MDDFFYNYRPEPRFIYYNTNPYLDEEGVLKRLFYFSKHKGKNKGQKGATSIHKSNKTIQISYRAGNSTKHENIDLALMERGETTSQFIFRQLKAKGLSDSAAKKSMTKVLKHHR